MKKIIAIVLALALVFSMSTVFAAAEEPVPGNGDEQYEDVYTLLDLLTDFFNRINLLIEYIITVFFPGAANA